MVNEVNKKEKTEKEVEEKVSETEIAEENLKEVEEKTEKEKAGKASFQETSSSKLPFIAIVVVIVLVAIALFFRGFNTVSEMSYMNNVHGYSYEYPQGMQLVAAGNIPAELALQGVKSMEQLIGQSFL